MKRLFLIITVILFASCAPTREVNYLIIDKPINFNEERRELSLDYIKERYDLVKANSKIIPKMIVLHWTAIPTLEASFNAFNPVKLPGARADIQKAGALNVSAHFLVHRNGEIYRLMPEKLMARHVIGLNHVAIGIENVGGTPKTPLTQAQIDANIWLVNYLANKYNIDYLIGHYEYTNFENHPLWKEKDSGYRTQKTDPGEDFMEAVRNATKNFNFKPIPQS
ncbi:MAG TPA: peptidoglycan recognition family protein [Salegentibacter sp.]|uniref:N-acetylmuramoyl-L-alanine amidase n=1 Tax=Salegentibacter sp. TaxID=1903072 RepID=UPI002F9460F6